MYWIIFSFWIHYDFEGKPHIGMLFYYRNAQRGLVETITHDLGRVMCILNLESIRVEEFNCYTSLWSLSSLESITTSSPSTNVTP